MRVLICGGRDYQNQRKIYDYVGSLPKDAVVIHGGARGADRIAGYTARKEWGLKVEPYPAQWGKYGLSAGFIRNQQMLDEGKPDIVVYFHDDIESSKGTKDMVARARKAGIKVLGNPTA